MTFDPHPPRIVRPDKAPPLLMTKAQKLEALDDAGVQGAAVVRFTEELSRWDPEMFVRAVLVDWLHVSEVWVGANFLFGRYRTGTFSLRPTVDQSGKTHIETHVFDLDKDIYGTRLRVGFVQRLRDERAFESVDALRAQIDADCRRARVLFDRLSL